MNKETLDEKGIAIRNVLGRESIFSTDFFVVESLVSACIGAFAGMSCLGEVSRYF